MGVTMIPTVLRLSVIRLRHSEKPAMYVRLFTAPCVFVQLEIHHIPCLDERLPVAMGHGNCVMCRCYRSTRVYSVRCVLTPSNEFASQSINNES